jgi:hypothetical protein
MAELGRFFRARYGSEFLSNEYKPDEVRTLIFNQIVLSNYR